MDILFVADPLSAFNIKKDTTYAMMAQAAARGHAVSACVQADLAAAPGGKIQANAAPVRMTGEKPRWYETGAVTRRALADFGAVVMRKDPPFDIEYFYATHLLERAEHQGAKVFNGGAALRNHPEKLAILEFPQFTSPTLVARDMAVLKEFHAQHQDVVFKPLDGMGGTGIFRCAAGERNLNVILETLTTNGSQTIMAQKFIPAISEGDKRILIIDGEPVSHCLARIPKAGETRGNLAAGGTGVVRELTARDREIAQTLGATLAPRGLLLIGMDVIGEHLTEINVTSPTCFQEITQGSGVNVADLFVVAVEKAVRAGAR